MRYHVDLPREYESQTDAQWPLVIFLHGSGERGADLELVRQNGFARMAREGHEFPFVLVTPQCDAGEWWEPDQIIALLDDVVAGYRVDACRVYLTGLSMGGFGTWDTAAHYPKRFAAVAPICGGGEPAQAAALVNVPVWAFHGTRDKSVDVARSVEMVDAIKAAGGTPTLTLYRGVGHMCWDRAYAGDALYTWFFEHALTQSG